MGQKDPQRKERKINKKRAQDPSLPNFLGPTFGYLDFLYLREEFNPGCPLEPGHSGYMTFGVDWAMLGTGVERRVLFAGNREGVHKNYRYLGQYDCERVTPMSAKAWATQPLKVIFLRLYFKPN